MVFTQSAILAEVEEIIKFTKKSTKRVERKVSHFLEPASDKKECIDELALILKRYIRIIDSLIAVTVGHPSSKSVRTEETIIPSEMSQVLPLLLQALGSSSNTIFLLSESPGLQTRDCLSISRSIVETAINICFIIAEGPEKAQKAFRHAKQKSLRDMGRESCIGGSKIIIKYLGKSDIVFDHNIQQDIEEFTSRSGREKGWTDLSIDERIKIVGQKYGDWVLTNLHMARFGIYRHSSEILHGTLFGVMYFYGMTVPSGTNKKSNEMKDLMADHHIGLLIAVISVLSVTIEVFHKAYGFQNAQDKYSKLLKQLKEIRYFSERKDESEGDNFKVQL